MNVLNICFITDENYSLHMGVAMTSIIHNRAFNTQLNFYIFDGGIEPQTKEKLNQLQGDEVKINYVTLHSIEKKIEILPQTAAHITKTSYFKYAIADLLPNLNKIIYLDADLIVKKPLDNLYNIELGDNLLAAVEDVGYSYHSRYNEKLKLKFKCMNSGVMLINCDLWRKEGLQQKLIEVTKKHDIVGFGQDQPVFNYVCRDRILFIPFEWNVQDTFFRDECEINNREDIELCHFAKDNPSIIHYTFVKKTWQGVSPSRGGGVSMSSEYWKYFDLYSPGYSWFLKIFLITYNRDYFLERTLKQILNDTSPIKYCDITILNNASTDQTDDIIARFQKKFPNIKHIKHRSNIGGNANICRAFEMAASCGKEYVWVLCDDDYYNWEAWSEVEQAMRTGADCIGVARYAIPNDEQLILPQYQMFQLTFVPAGIYKTTNITSTILTNMYNNIYSMFPHNSLVTNLINCSKKIHFIKSPIVEQGLHIEDKNAPKIDCSYYRGVEATEISFRTKEQCWIIGFANIIRLLKDKILQQECMEVSILYKDIYGDWDKFYNHIIHNYGIYANKFHYLLEILTVLPHQHRLKVFMLTVYAIFRKCCKKVLTHIFSLKNTEDKKYKVLTILGVKFKVKRLFVKFNGCASDKFALHLKE